MEFTEFEALRDDSGRRLDRILKRIFMSGCFCCENIFKLIRKGLVRVNGEKSRPDRIVNEGDIISVAAFLLQKEHPEKKQEIFIPRGFSAKTVFKNQHIWIFSKDAGISVQPENGAQFCLSNFAAAEYKGSQGGQPLSFRPGPLHRLDKHTTGLVAFSQSLEGARWFSQELKNHSVKKTYLAAVENHFSAAEPLRYDDSIGGKEAHTSIQPLAAGMLEEKEISLVQVQIETGRRHQIRKHCALHGHPLFGDTLYGGKKISLSGLSGCRFFLHAWKLSVPENSLGIPPELTAPVPPLFKAMAERAFPGLQDFSS